jgi:hypothetical protein
MRIRPLAIASLAFSSLGAAALAQPAITFSTADAKPTQGGSMLRILGSGFGLNPTVLFDATTNVPVLASRDTVIICFVPPGTGSHSVTVVNGTTSNAVNYTYDAPVVTLATPNPGPIAGNFQLGITGRNFGTTPTVSIGGLPAPLVTASDSSMFVTAPAGIGLNKTILVTVGGLPSVGGPTFSYQGPTVFSIIPNPAASGASIDIGGLNLGLAGAIDQPTVKIDDQIAVVASVSVTDLVATVPVGAGANLPVTVTLAGQSTTSSTTFSYPAPNITGRSPATGSTAGGYTMVISGTNFGRAGQSTVTIGGVTAPVTAASNTSLTVTVPAGQGVSVPIVVTAAGQTSNTSIRFTYNSPLITGIRPAFGPAQGGAPVIIDGQNFGTSATVVIGGQNAPVICQSHTAIACLSPSRPGGAGLANAPVSVTVAAQSSNNAQYSFICSSDFNKDGTLAIQDIFDFLTAWFGGCP